jgi:DNA polymerase-1
VHASFNPVGARTGRLSASNPNLQQIPSKTERGREIRQAVVAAPGHLLVVADYSQIELRILARVARDQGLLDAFLSGHDFHTATAAKMFRFQWCGTEVRKSARTTCKQEAMRFLAHTLEECEARS